MSKILDRYIFAELLPPFATSLATLCFIVLTKEMLRLVELLVSKGIGLFPVFKIVLHLLPSFLVLTLPIACLIASITTFSRLSYDNELTAMRATGISLLRLSIPVLLFSCLGFLLTLILSQWGQPWSNFSLKKLALNLIRDQLTLALDSGVFNEPTTGMVVYVPERQGDRQSAGVFIFDQRDPSRPLIIVARAYQILNNPKHNELGLRLLDGIIHQPPRNIQQYHQVAFATYDLKMDVSQTVNNAVRQRPGHDEILTQVERSDWKDAGALRRLMEYYKDLAFPVSALILGMLGLPIGIVSKRSGRVGGFAIGVVIMILYYLLNMLGEFLVTTLILHPFAGAWLPNAITLGIAITLFARTAKR